MVIHPARIAPSSTAHTRAASSAAPTSSTTTTPANTASAADVEALYTTAPLGHFAAGLAPHGRHAWTPDTLRAAMERSPTLRRDVDALLKRARNTVDKPLKALHKIESEGLLKDDPRKIRTQQTLKRIDDVSAWAFAARMGPPDLRDKAQKRVNETLVDWAKHYKPTGNPINENRLLPMMQAADMALPTMSKADQHTVRGWMKNVLHASERYPLQGMCKINNWKTFNLQIRSTAATVLGDKPALHKAGKELDALLEHTIRSDGSSLDFHHRDAFHYHLYNSQALLNMATYAPGAVSAKSRHLIEKTFEFVKPYYLGQKHHVEFKHTQVQFDRTRGDHGDPKYQPHQWNPREADALLQQARAVFPSLREWTGPSEAASAGLLGEFAASLRWPDRPLTRK